MLCFLAKSCVMLPVKILGSRYPVSVKNMTITEEWNRISRTSLIRNSKYQHVYVQRAVVGVVCVLPGAGPR